MVIISVCLWLIIGMILYFIELGYLKFCVSADHKTDDADQFNEGYFFVNAVLGPITLVLVIGTFIKHYKLVKQDDS